MPSNPTLVQRPEAVVYSIPELMDRVRRGDVRIPLLQRKLRWKSQDIKELFDSIYRGYPIGTLLFWRHAENARTFTLGPVEIHAPTRQSALVVIDGQQRVTSLAGVLMHPDSIGAIRDPFALFFDLATEKFERRRGSRPLSHDWIPLNLVLDTSKLLEWLSLYPGRNEHPNRIELAMHLSRSIREYNVPACVVDAEDEKPLRVIFDRLNSTGRRLKATEVFQSLQGGVSDRPPFDLRTLATALSDSEFGKIEEEWLLNGLFAIQGLDLTKDKQVQIAGSPDLMLALPRLENALRNVIVFLQLQAQVPHISLLPDQFPLAPLIKFFDLHPEPRSRSQILLARWLWRGAISGEHRIADVAKIRDTIKSIDADEEESVQRMLRLSPHVKPAEALDLQFSFRTARTKIHIMALAVQRPIDLESGRPLSIGQVLNEFNASAVSALFPVGRRKLLESYGIDPVRHRALLASLANHFLHPSWTSLRQRVFDLSTPLGERFLSSHAISGVAMKALLGNDGVVFLQERERTLRTVIQEFTNKRAAWGANDRPSLESLMVSDSER